MKLSEFQSDTKREKEGVWHSLDETTRIKVARMGNPRFTRAFRRIIGPYEVQIDTGRLDPDKAETLWAEVFAESILVDWEGFTDDEGNPIPYSKAEAQKALTAMRNLRDLVRSLSEKAEVFRAAQLDEDAEHLKSGVDVVA